MRRCDRARYRQRLHFHQTLGASVNRHYTREYRKAPAQAIRTARQVRMPPLTTNRFFQKQKEKRVIRGAFWR